jgi:hypothetical protein
MTGTEFFKLDLHPLGTSLIVLGVAFVVSGLVFMLQSERKRSDQTDQGTVTEMDWAGVTVRWDNRGERAILHNDMGQIERVA